MLIPVIRISKIFAAWLIIYNILTTSF